ncbi:helix-turn-helix domain-containing protein [Streptosporangiaceae bacterium NEAU-GS5]|nr:helix-turn-helix domain-containing protein [Streptosporangiaceae bacterium NEAU-GS5]
MKDLTIRLDALDPQAGAALRVITYFDDLLAHNAGIQAIVRAAAVLSAGPAALVDEARQVRLRVDEAGRLGEPAAAPDPAWPSVPVGSGGGLLWLEQSGPPRPVDAMVLERAAAAAAAVLDRTRGRRDSVPYDQASTEILLDPASPREARTAALRRLRLPETAQVRAVARADGKALVQLVSAAPDPSARAGVGPAGGVADLPASWAAARLALRLTAEGTPDDPGPRIVHADQSGALMVLAAAVGPATPPIADVVALEHAVRSAPWMAATLDAVATSASVRSAAAALRVHHSTLQERIAHAGRLLGWSVDDPAGRLRLHLALVLRRLHRAASAM